MLRSPSFRTYVLLSLAVHAVIVAGLLFFEKVLEPTHVPRESVSIDFLTPEELAQQQLAQNPPRKKQIPQVPANQIVEQDATRANEEEPVDTRFLSEKNQVVKKQTIAQDRGQFQNIKKAAKEKPGQKGDGKEKQEALAKDLFKGFDPHAAMEKQKLAEKESGKGLGNASNEDAVGKGADVSQSSDYIKDVDSGLETMLNTREFKYYSYYNRIRRQLSQHWEGRVREKLSKLFREGRAPAATGQDRITKLMIVLNDKGTLVRVQVMSDSGVRDLDDAAIEAFRAAAPFPNPPKGIVESDGTVKIRWDFVLET
ncbi:transport protein TonB [compost metagenome]